MSDQLLKHKDTNIFNINDVDDAMPSARMPTFPILPMSEITSSVPCLVNTSY